MDGPPAGVGATALREAMARFPTGVTAITTLLDGQPAGLAANSVSSLSLDPPLIFAAVDRGSRTLGAIEASGRFAVNVLGAEAAGLARGFGRKIPVEQRWRGVGWEPVGTSAGPIPKLDAAIVWVGCRLDQVISGGDHLIVTGEVLGIEQRPGAPLLFHEGAYRPLNG